MTALLLVLALGCKGEIADSDGRDCPREEIVPALECTPELRGYYVCATCDPAYCPNCPISWVCDGPLRQWSGSDLECDCIAEDGTQIQDPACLRDDS